MNLPTGQATATPRYEDRPDRLWRSTGRIGRARWWWAYQVPTIAIGLVMALRLPRMHGEGALVLLVLFSLVILCLLLLGSVKRLHDHGYSGKWVLLLVALMIAGDQLEAWGVLPWIAPHTDLVNLPLGLFTLVLFGCLRGTRGPNRFGPDPVRSASPESLDTDAQRQLKARL